MIHLLDYVPIAAAAFAIPQFVPQIRKLRATHDTAGVSWSWAALTSLNNAAWIVYFTLASYGTALVPSSSATLLAGTLTVMLTTRGKARLRPLVLITAWAATLVTAFGVAGRTGLGTLLTAAFAVQVMPSIWTAYRTARPTGISPGTWTLILGELTCWLIFGLHKSDPRLIALGVTGVTASALMLARIHWSRGLRTRVGVPLAQRGSPGLVELAIEPPCYPAPSIDTCSASESEPAYREPHRPRRVHRGPQSRRAHRRAMTGDRIPSARICLVPLTVTDAGEMVRVLSAESLYTFTGGSPPTLDELRARYARQAAGRSPDGSQEWRNWIIRREPGGQAVGYLQATIMDSGTRAEIAWMVGVDWQGRGYAAEAARALVAWLDSRGIKTVQAHIHPRHAASAAVARRAGLLPTGHIDDGEELWQRNRGGGPARGRAGPV
jgi:RimJ/RimL family protein N-acetyltransferase